MSVLTAEQRAQLHAHASTPALADAAIDHLERWLSEPLYVAYVPLIERLLADACWDLLLDSFYQVLPFGTGGRRGPVGVGPNRINPVSIESSVQGHVAFLRKAFPEVEQLSVVVAADVRHFQDLRGRYPTDVANPLSGMTSRSLARLCCEVYAGNGVKVWTLDAADPRFMATPELSWCIRETGAQGGLNISASHNHPDDNGGKFYNALGGQEIPPDDERLVAEVEKVTEVHRLAWDEALAGGWIRVLPASLYRGYLDLNLALSRSPERAATIVFTNLHGVGDDTAGRILEDAGFQVHYVESQRAHDGAFPGVPFRAPNPEQPSALAAAEALARKVGADLVLATDPDADRIGGLMPRPDGSWRFINGNEVSVMLAHYVFEGNSSPRAIGIKTEVTSSLFSRVVRAAGGQVVEHLLVGCKYIADVVRKLDEDGRFGDVVGGAEDVLIGTEESHGVLLSTRIRDKDAGGAGLLLAELAAREKARGSSLLGYLEGIYKRHGYTRNRQVNLRMSGAAGRARLLAIMDGLRKLVAAGAPFQLGTETVVESFDRRDEAGVFGRIVSETDRSSRNVLAFHTASGSRVVVRPSGTEPKAKLYCEVSAEPLGAEASDEALAAQIDKTTVAAEHLAAAMRALALSQVGIELPAWVFAASDLLEVETLTALAETLDDALAGEGPARTALVALTEGDALVQMRPAIEQRAAALGHTWPAVLALLGRG